MSWLDDPRIRTGDAAACCGIAPETLLSWIDRGRLKLGPHDRDSAGSGDARLLTPRRVHQIALAAAISRHGVPVRTAAAIARKFTDEPSDGRAAGELYACGHTWLVQDSPAAARVVNDLPAAGARVALICNVRPIVADVNARLAHGSV
jgi:hypothetical protein